MGTILDRIVETKRAEVARAQNARPLRELQKTARDLPAPRDFHGALAADPPSGVHLIAEIKRKSPSAGVIRADFDPVSIAQVYHRAGASALSVLTDETYFDGRLDYIRQVKEAVPLPVLRKDFMIDPYQVYEARTASADAILLIGEILEPRQLVELLDLAFGLGMTSLIEVHEEATLRNLLEVLPFPNQRRTLLGVNNRNLKIQKTDLATTESLARLVGPGTLLVSESGLQSRADVERMIAAGARALLIGETFMRADDIGGKVRELLGV